MRAPARPSRLARRRRAHGRGLWAHGDKREIRLRGSWRSAGIGFASGDNSPLTKSVLDELGEV